jgi:hypothetical protein
MGKVMPALMIGASRDPGYGLASIPIESRCIILA